VVHQPAASREAATYSRYCSKRTPKQTTNNQHSSAIRHSKHILHKCSKSLSVQSHKMHSAHITPTRCMTVVYATSPLKHVTSTRVLKVHPMTGRAVWCLHVCCPVTSDGEVCDSDRMYIRNENAPMINHDQNPIATGIGKQHATYGCMQLCSGQIQVLLSLAATACGSPQHSRTAGHEIFQMQVNYSSSLTATECKCASAAGEFQRLCSKDMTLCFGTPRVCMMQGACRDHIQSAVTKQR